MKWTFSRLTLVVLVALAFIVWSQVIYGESASSDNLEVAFLDVGQGDAIFITLPNGEQALIDGGPDNTVLAQISDYMPPLDRKIEHIVLTHPHADHLNGLIKVLERYEVGTIYEARLSYESGAYRNWQEQINLKKIARREISQNDVLDWGEVAFEVLWPISSALKGGGESNVNNSSVVGRLVYQQTAFMLTGDAETEAQKTLCDLGEAKLKSDVIKVAHHGSQNGTVTCFMEAVSPDWAIISSGKDNKFGHPHAVVLRILEEFVARTNILKTMEQGTVVCGSNGEVVNCK